MTSAERDDALLTMGQSITAIAMRSLEQDRDLIETEIAAIIFLARNILEWCSPPSEQKVRAVK